jgi:aryl-alcohol dehydrogenase-like predicted oxidoreductase
MSFPLGANLSQGAEVKIKRLGRTGLKVTEVCLGTMTFGQQCDEPTSFRIMDEAAEAGITFIDIADVYPVRYRWKLAEGPRRSLAMVERKAR